MRLFSQNSGSILDQFSSEFESGFLRTLSHLHGTKRVQVNRVYQEYIQDKNHVHMNATTWTTLTGFCKYVGKEGKAIVDETEKGWFIQYVDRDPTLLAKQQSFDSRKREELEDEERQNRLMALQIRIAQEAQLNEVEHDNHDNEIHDDDDNENTKAEGGAVTAPVLSISLTATGKFEQLKKKRLRQSVFGDDNDNHNQEDNDNQTTAAAAATTTIASQAAAEAEQAKRELELLRDSQVKRMRSYGILSSTLPPSSSLSSSAVSSATTLLPSSSSSSSSSSVTVNGTASTTTTATAASTVTATPLSSSSSSLLPVGWLFTGLVVKIVSKSVDSGRQFGQKAEIVKVYDDKGEDGRYSCKVALLDYPHDVFTVRDRDLETVVPRVSLFTATAID
jgi:hypothetical protein